MSLIQFLRDRPFFGRLMALTSVGLSPEAAALEGNLSEGTRASEQPIGTTQNSLYVEPAEGPFIRHVEEG